MTEFNFLWSVFMATHKNTKHGESFGPTQTAEYRAWCSMKRRCYNNRAASFHRYGGRGIKVCSRWLNGEYGMSGYGCFLLDMGRKPQADYSLDRIDGNGDYSPSNCKWSTKTEQSQNRYGAVFVQHGGRRERLATLCATYGISTGVVRKRLEYGWSLLLALTTEVGPRGHFSKRTNRITNPNNQ